MANPKTKNILISMMIAMSSAFLIWSILLLSRDTYAAGNPDGKSYQYTWYADTREVVSEAVFVKSWNLTAEVWKMKVENEWVMRITSGAVVSSGNNLNPNWKNSNIIWWSGNKIGYGVKNITLLWWYKNTVSEWGNGVIIGWSGHFSLSTNQSTILWWINNKTSKNSSGGFIIWWSNNVNTGEYTFILWWSGNVDKWWKWLKYSIVVWSNLSRNVNFNVSNVFVFSNVANFNASTSGTFYINATKWLWISWPSTKSWVNVHGIVKVWNLKTLISSCNLWEIWERQGCLVWCAKKNGNVAAKWHLIDKSETCQNLCKTDSNCEKTSTADTTRKLRKGICTGGVANNPNNEKCGSAKRAESLTGVSFISYFTPVCPKDGENGMVNPCAYTCSDMNDDRCKAGSPNGGDNPTTPDIPDNICWDRKFKCKGADLINTGHNGDQNEYYWTCKKWSITQKCGLCDENSINAGEVPPTLHNGYCANQDDPDNEQCCQKIPQNAHPLFFDRESDNGIGHLCTNIAFTPNPNSNEDNSTCTRTDADNNLHSFEDLHGNDICPCYGNHSWWRVKSCITTQNSNGLDVKECVDLWEFFCDNNGSITYEQAMETEKFECDPWYVLDWCNCVKNDDHSNPDYWYLSCGWEPNTCKEWYIWLWVSKNGSNLNWMCSNGLGTEYWCFLSCEEPQYWQEHSNIWFCSNPSTETLSCCPEWFKKQQDWTCKISANLFKVKTETWYIVKEPVKLLLNVLESGCEVVVMEVVELLKIKIEKNIK